MQKMKCKGENCTGELIWQNDYDFEDCGYSGEGIVGVYMCSECELIHELLTSGRIVELKICEYGVEEEC